MHKNLVIASDVTSGAGIAIGLSNIYTLLGIILVIVNLGILITNFILRMVDRRKSKSAEKDSTTDNQTKINDLDEADRKIKSLLDEINERLEKLNNDNKDGE